MVEAAVGVIAACMPTLRPLLRSTGPLRHISGTFHSRFSFLSSLSGLRKKAHSKNHPGGNTRNSDDKIQVPDFIHGRHQRKGSSITALNWQTGPDIDHNASMEDIPPESIVVRNEFDLHEARSDDRV